jgi:glycosyltransferase involved in cell wall biosynthesis
MASSALPDSSRNHTYREAEDAGIREILPRLVAERRPDVILIGRESSVGEVPPVGRRHGIPTVALVQGGITIRRILADDGDALARHQLDQLRQVDAVVAIAEYLRRDLAPLGLRRVAVIPNPVDLERFTPGPKPPALLDALRLGAGQVVVSHVSNFKPAKRVIDIVESAANVLAEDPDVVYLLVGDGPERAPIESRCRALGLAERVRSVGWVDSAEIPAYLRLTDVVVMASESEGLPLIYLEAQASGRLLVASDIPATRELVADGDTGLIFRTGDVGDLAAMTLLAAQDPTLRAAIGRAARAAVRAYAKPAILDAYVRLLEGLVSAAAQRAAPDLPRASRDRGWPSRSAPIPTRSRRSSA